MDRVQLGACAIDLQTGEICPNGDILTPRELQLLVHLAARPGVVVSRADLLRDAFGYRAGVRSRAVEQTMLTLRKKVEPDPAAPAHLRTVGAGYCLEQTRVASRRAPLVGRDDDVRRVEGLLGEPGLVTVTGPGGVGKTALAEHVAARWTGFVAVCGSTHPEGALGRALGADAEPAILVRALAARAEPLVVLDGAESVERGLVGALAARVRVLVTSRIPLDLPGERVVRLEPLARADAVALLDLRAGERGLEVSGDKGVLVDHLDRLPLAIELAAPWLAALTPEALVARADRPYDEVLAQVFDRSWAMLRPEDRELLGELTVFGGRFRLDDAEAVAERPALERVERLVRSSMIQRSPAAELHLLDVVRVEAARRVDPRILARAAAAHAARAIATDDPDELATAAIAATRGGRLATAATLLEALNERAAFLGGVPPATCVRLGEALVAADPGPRSWLILGRARLQSGAVLPAEEHFRRVLDGSADRALRVGAWLGLGRTRLCLQDAEGAAAAYDAVEAQLSTPAEIGAWWLGKAMLADVEARADDALQAAERALEVLRSAGLEARALVAEVVRVGLLALRGDLRTARALADAAIVSCRALGASLSVLRFEAHRAGILEVEDPPAAVEAARSLRAAHLLAGRTFETAIWTTNLGGALIGVGEYAEAALVLGEALTTAEAHGLVHLRGCAERLMGRLALREGRPAEAVDLLEAAVARFEATPRERVTALADLGLALEAAGRAAEGERAITRAVRLADELGIRPDSLAGRELGLALGSAGRGTRVPERQV